RWRQTRPVPGFFPGQDESAAVLDSTGDLLAESGYAHRLGHPCRLLGGGAGRVGVHLCGDVEVLVADVAAGGCQIGALEQVGREGVAEVVRADVAEFGLLGGDGEGAAEVAVLDRLLLRALSTKSTPPGLTLDRTTTGDRRFSRSGARPSPRPRGARQAATDVNRPRHPVRRHLKPARAETAVPAPI